MLQPAGRKLASMDNPADAHEAQIIRSWNTIANGRWRCEPFDAAVCNFSLLGKESVDSLIGAMGGAPSPWYFRTLESWISLLRRSGFELIECREPTAPDGVVPASVIFVGKRCSAEQTNHLDSR